MLPRLLEGQAVDPPIVLINAGFGFKARDENSEEITTWMNERPRYEVTCYSTTAGHERLSLPVFTSRSN